MTVTAMARAGHLRAAAWTDAAGAADGSTTVAIDSASRSNTPGASYTQFPDPMHASRSIEISRAIAGGS